MPKCFAEIIRSIEPNADVEKVGDIASERFRHFGDLSRDDWATCVAATKT